MNKKESKHRAIVFFTVIAVFSAVMIIIVALQKITAQDYQYAEIYQNGKLVEKINIKNSNGYELTINDDNGYNIILVKDGKIGITDADCPDKTCIRTGFISGGVKPIICLPHKLEIKLIDENSDNISLDAAAE